MPGSYCLINARQDIENAKRTVQEYIYSVTWNPTVDATFAYRGTIAIGVGSTSGIAGKMWQKQDDGCTTNWTEFSDNGDIVSELQVRYVDQGNGNDTTGDGSKYKPFKTITAALNAITDAATAKRYMIRIAAGVYTEALTWKDWVSAVGDGYEATRLTGAFTHTIGPTGAAGRMSFSGLSFEGAMTLNHQQAGSNVNVRFFHCRLIAPTYNGPPGPYGVASAGNFFLHACFVFNVVVTDAALHMYEGGAILGSLTIADGTDAFAEINGCLLQGTITLNGRGKLYTKGCLTTANVVGVNASGTDPFWELDESSQTTGSITQPLKLQFDDDKAILHDSTVSGLVYNHTGKHDIILVDASAGAVTVNLLAADHFVQNEIIVKKIDASANPVNLNVLVDGAPVSLTAQWQYVRAISNSANYYEV